jgi:hypothetical protein
MVVTKNRGLLKKFPAETQETEAVKKQIRRILSAEEAAAIGQGIGEAILAIIADPELGLTDAQMERAMGKARTAALLIAQTTRPKRP